MLTMAMLCLCLTSTASARRLVFWSNSIANKISYAPVIEGGKGADLPINPSYVNDPYGTAIDSAAGKVYWLNRGNGGSIGVANLDGSGAGLLNTSGTSFAEPSGLAIDPAAGKILLGQRGKRQRLNRIRQLERQRGQPDQTVGRDDRNRPPSRWTPPTAASTGPTTPTDTISYAAPRRQRRPGHRHVRCPG